LDENKILHNLEKVIYEPFISGSRYGINISLCGLNVASEELRKWFSGIFTETDTEVSRDNDKNSDPGTLRISGEGTLLLSVVSPASEL
jgi:hypothetical protein